VNFISRTKHWRDVSPNTRDVGLPSFIYHTLFRFVLRVQLACSAGWAIDCFKCVSIDGDNKPCDDPFHNNGSRAFLESPCLGGRKGRDGLFPATACLKIAGVYGNKPKLTWYTIFIHFFLYLYYVKIDRFLQKSNLNPKLAINHLYLLVLNLCKKWEFHIDKYIKHCILIKLTIHWLGQFNKLLEITYFVLN